MDIGQKTPFDHVPRFRAELADNRKNLDSIEGKAWLKNRYSQLITIVRTEKDVLLSWNDHSISDPTPIPQEGQSLSAIGRMSAGIFLWWVLFKLVFLGRNERHYEECRIFFEWLYTLQGLKSVYLKVVGEDLDNLLKKVKAVREELLSSSYSKSVLTNGREAGRSR